MSGTILQSDASTLNNLANPVPCAVHRDTLGWSHVLRPLDRSVGEAHTRYRLANGGHESLAAGASKS
jgi:hypothetical protein